MGMLRYWIETAGTLPLPPSIPADQALERIEDALRDEFRHAETTRTAETLRFRMSLTDYVTRSTWKPFIAIDRGEMRLDRGGEEPVVSYRFSFRNIAIVIAFFVAMMVTANALGNNGQYALIPISHILLFLGGMAIARACAPSVTRRWVARLLGT